VSGETDFPCISGARVGQGRVYVQLGKVDRVDFTDWCSAIAKGRSYVSDGYAHALEFKVEGQSPVYADVRLDKPGKVPAAGKAARASRKSAEWCVGVIEQLGRVRGSGIAEHEREEAERTFKRAIEYYKKRAEEAPNGS